MIKPLPLTTGGRIAVLGIASPGDPARFDAGLDALERMGFHPEPAPNIARRSRSYLAGTDVERAEILNRVLREESWDAIVFARGGYGTMRVLELVDWDAVARFRRPMIGYSDLTAWSQACWVRAGLSTFHGPMVHLDFAAGLSADRERWFLDSLAGAAPMSWPLDGHTILEHGRAEGTLFGGCLSLLVATMGTPWDGWVDDGILFWEEVDEPTYRIDRMLTQLELAGRLRRIRGVLIGRLKDCGRPVEGELDEVIREFFMNRGIPVVADAPFGHHGDNLLLPYGQRVVLDTAAGTLAFPEPMVTRVQEAQQ